MSAAKAINGGIHWRKANLGLLGLCRSVGSFKEQIPHATLAGGSPGIKVAAVACATRSGRGIETFLSLAARRLRYWHNLDYPAARFWAEPIDERFAKVGTYEIYWVACNLVNGLPPRYRDGPAR